MQLFQFYSDVLDLGELAKLGEWLLVTSTHTLGCPLFSPVSLANLNEHGANILNIDFNSCTSHKVAWILRPAKIFHSILHQRQLWPAMPCKKSLAYRISGILQAMKVFIIKNLTVEIYSERSAIGKIYLHSITYTLMPIAHAKMQKRMKVPYLLEYMPRHYWYFLHDILDWALKRGGLLIKVMQHPLKLLVRCV